ncbi:hypothetical protein CVT24_008417, partial [Panaeolus cyanescens]
MDISSSSPIDDHNESFNQTEGSNVDLPDHGMETFDRDNSITSGGELMSIHGEHGQTPSAPQELSAMIPTAPANLQRTLKHSLDFTDDVPRKVIL